jgi:hypothetical protein
VSKKIKMDKKEFVKEHKKLVQTLESGSKDEQKKEAAEQKKELKEQTKTSKAKCTKVDCNEDGIPDKVERHSVGGEDPRQASKSSMKKAEEDYYLDKQEFIKVFKKSYDYRDVAVSIDAKEQHAAEESVDSKLVKYVKDNSDKEISTIEFEKGTLTLNKKGENLYNGFFSGTDGQVVEKFDDKTAELIVKNLMLKDVLSIPNSQVVASQHEDEAEDKELIDEAIDEHNDKMHSEAMDREETPTEGPTYFKFRCGDLEFELRKSLTKFVKSYKKATFDNKKFVEKAIRSWTKLMKSRTPVRNDIEAVKLLLGNWDSYREEFMQTVHAVEQRYKFVSKIKNKK